MNHWDSPIRSLWRRRRAERLTIRLRLQMPRSHRTMARGQRSYCRELQEQKEDCKIDGDVVTAKTQHPVSSHDRGNKWTCDEWPGLVIQMPDD